MDNKTTKPNQDQPTAKTQKTPEKTTKNKPEKNAAKSTPAPKTTKKSKKAPWIIAIIIFVLLLCGGGFAAFAIIKNQPDNIARDAINNFFTAKSVKIDGTAKLSFSSASLFGIKSIGLDFDASSANSNHITNTTVRIGLGDNNEITLANIGETMLENGIFYLKLSGIKNTYDTYAKSLVSSYLSSSFGNSKYAATYTKKYLSLIDEMLNYIEDRWFEISLEDIKNDEMYDSISSVVSFDTNAEYNCIADKRNNFEKYSDEFSKLYDQNSFIVLKSGQDSFYNVTFDPQKTANYVNAIPDTTFYSDVMSCVSSEAPALPSEQSITSDDVVRILEYSPEISAKFDGFFSHTLSELKVSKDYDSFNFNSDFKFSYPNNLTVVAPEESTPIMEFVHKIYEIAAKL
ncbi:hypothetical protein IKX73_02965 [Candidatus Saccharibacteria bacterium]|nr:hypothetical protein [Candidatus Saccharibacteria bacterium]